MKPIFKWILLAMAAFQFVMVALPPGNADLISIQSLALDLSHGKTDLLYPGKNYIHNVEWVAHHEANLKELGDTGEPNWCFYPPLIPFIVSPLANFSATSWKVVWGGLQFLMIIAFVLLMERLLVVSAANLQPSRVLLFALVLGSYPLARAIELGQTSLLIALLVWGGFYLNLMARDKLKILLVGLAVFIKPFMAVVEIPNLVRKKFSPLVAVAVVVGSLLILSLIMTGLQANAEYVNLLTTLSSSQTAYYGNQSFFGGIMRIFSDYPANSYGFLHESDFAAVGKLFFFIILVIALIAQFRGKDKDPFLSTGLWLSAVTLALPISWDHHALLLLPVLAYLWSRASQKWEYGLMGLITLLAGINLQPVYDESMAGRLLACLPMLGNLILLALLIVLHTQKGNVLFQKQLNLLEPDVRS